MRSENVTEAALTEAARGGDSEAFGRLVLTYALVARRVAFGMLRNWDEADDVVQEAAFAAWQAMDRFDPGRSFRPWFLRIVSNAALDQLRRRRVRKAEPLSEALESDTGGTDVLADRRLLRERIDDAMRELPERHRVAVMLFDGDGLSHREIADVLKVPEGTVRSYVFHARRALRRALANLVEGPA